MQSRRRRSARAHASQEIKDLGADTLRIEVNWNEVAPQPGREDQAGSFDAADPAAYPGDPNAYPGFGPYDDLVRQANALGFRILITITGDTPRWATGGRQGRELRDRQLQAQPDRVRAASPTAVAQALLGQLRRACRRCDYFSIWNEPNHQHFLKPPRDAPAHLPQPGRTRRAGDPRQRRVRGVKVFVGELAPVGRAPKVDRPDRRSSASGCA